MTRIARLRNPDNPVHVRSQSETDGLARKVGRDLQIAKTLGITIPQSVLVRATRVIE